MGFGKQRLILLKSERAVFRPKNYWHTCKMAKLEKDIKKFAEREKRGLIEIIRALQLGRFDNLNLKKLKGGTDIFRARKGKIRIIYQIRNGRIFILKIGRRKEDTYKF